MQKSKKSRIGPDLDIYIEGSTHRYTTYEKAAVMYGLPYYTFVKLAKKAKATWKIRKTVIVDLVKVDEYLERKED